MILVTGGAGFIGSVLIKYLNDLGKRDIIVVDRWRQGQKWLNLRNLHFSNYYQADEFFAELKLNPMIGPSLKEIYHLGACSDTTETNMDYLWKNNVVFSQKIFQLATDLNLGLVYASSAATYGDGNQGLSDGHEHVSKLKPLNPYGQSKQFFDMWALNQLKTPPRWFGVKFFNVFGPHEYHKKSMVSVAYQAYQQIQESGKVKLFKSHRDDYVHGEQIRDFIYVKDVVRALVELMKHRGPQSKGLINLGTGQGRTFNDLVNIIFKAVGAKEKIEYIDMPEHLQNQYQYYTQADMTKFKELFPQFAFSSLEESATDYIQRFLHTPDPYLGSLIKF
jgi:ADP-L-glycero-D-manno-heptose 6-epimerase